MAFAHRDLHLDVRPDVRRDLRRASGLHLVPTVGDRHPSVAVCPLEQGHRDGPVHHLREERFGVRQDPEVGGSCDPSRTPEALGAGESAFRTTTEAAWTLEEAGAFHCPPVLPGRALTVPHHDGPARQEHQRAPRARHHAGVEQMTHLRR